jgi:hypothetical protein
MTAMTGATTTEVIVVMIAMMIITMTDVMSLRQQPEGENSTATAQRGQPQWYVPEG